MEPQPSRPDRSHGIPSPEGERTGVADLERGIAESESGAAAQVAQDAAAAMSGALGAGRRDTTHGRETTVVVTWSNPGTAVVLRIVAAALAAFAVRAFLDDPGAEGGIGWRYGERETHPS